MSGPMKFLNLRDWEPDIDDTDPEMVDDDDTEVEYRLAEVEAVQMVRDGVWE